MEMLGSFSTSSQGGTRLESHLGAADHSRTAERAAQEGKGVGVLGRVATEAGPGLREAFQRGEGKGLKSRT